MGKIADHSAERQVDVSTPQVLKREVNRFPVWALRFWHGMTLGGWLRLAAGHRFRIHPFRIPMAGIVTGIAGINTTLRLVQQLVYGRAIRETDIQQPPLFVLGHWRSGTTLLHELLVQDPRFAYPTTYECFAANHFVLSGRVLPHLLWWLLPSKRPMDNMPVSFAHPQEDEFALIALGAPTPLLKIAFPNDPPPYMELLDMADVPPDVLRRWRDALLHFARAQTYLKQKPLVLKSPSHTGRIGVLDQMFPGAKFVHLVRDPYAMFPSNRRLWVGLEEAQAFQFSRHEHLDEFIFTALERMYRSFEAERRKLDPARICDVRYEDLVQDPLGELRRVYAALELGDFEPVREKVDAYLTGIKDYRVNRHALDGEIEAQIRRRWGDYLERYGYE